ncbi:uncharacterized protein FTOL_13418 [Fusarium torulosum]|uniref:Uncharacterized protein n=1 Tax=Fusarium torulosum TaxID=33205 RepID=A0AAE8MM27_9HYPO|nr:uncharacterized protein FTOL_13418 [Fusarium torulosum]
MPELRALQNTGGCLVTLIGERIYQPDAAAALVPTASLPIPSFESGTGHKHDASYLSSTVSSSTSFWNGHFNQVGNNFILGTSQAGEAAVGQLKSSSFRASSVMSFLIGGGHDLDSLYVGLVWDKDNKLLLKQTGTNGEAFIRIIWDTSMWAGQMVHIVVHDSRTSNSWGLINIDDVCVGCHALDNDIVRD